MITGKQKTQNRTGEQRTIYMHNMTRLQLEKMKRATGESASKLIAVAVEMLYKSIEANPGHALTAEANVAEKEQAG